MKLHFHNEVQSVDDVDQEYSALPGGHFCKMTPGQEPVKNDIYPKSISSTNSITHLNLLTTLTWDKETTMHMWLINIIFFCI